MEDGEDFLDDLHSLTNNDSPVYETSKAKRDLLNELHTFSMKDIPIRNNDKGRVNRLEMNDANMQKFYQNSNDQHVNIRDN